jgi:hypothetical protein
VRRGGAALTEARRASIRQFIGECRTCLLADVVSDEEAFGQGSPWGTAYDVSPEAAYMWFVQGVRRAVSNIVEASSWRDELFVVASGQLGSRLEERLARRAQLRERLRGFLTQDFCDYWVLPVYRFHF